MIPFIDHNSLRQHPPPRYHTAQPPQSNTPNNSAAKTRLGQFLADHYKQTTPPASFSSAKYNKKLANMSLTSHCIAIIVSHSPNSKAPEVEEVCSVAMAVQNMHLTATALHVGAYWSSASCVSDKSERSITNPPEVREFLGLQDGEVCLGWFVVGRYEGPWTKGRRKGGVEDYTTFRNE